MLPQAPEPVKPVDRQGDVNVGCARPDCATSAPNERIQLADLIRHGQLLIDVLYSCADQPV